MEAEGFCIPMWKTGLYFVTATATDSASYTAGLLNIHARKTLRARHFEEELFTGDMQQATKMKAVIGAKIMPLRRHDNNSMEIIAYTVGQHSCHNLSLAARRLHCNHKSPGSSFKLLRGHDLVLVSTGAILSVHSLILRFNLMTLVRKTNY